MCSLNSYFIPSLLFFLCFSLFQVANFEFVDETDQKNGSEEEGKGGEKLRASEYWDNLLGDKYEELKTKEFEAMGKGKRNRKQVN